MADLTLEELDKLWTAQTTALIQGLGLTPKLSRDDTLPTLLTRIVKLETERDREREVRRHVATCGLAYMKVDGSHGCWDAIESVKRRGDLQSAIAASRKLDEEESS